uniref:Importin subunit alpha n=1 Tax=Panagrolaimus davidi TaxID=227884 RepID=A0A914QPX5_9BILA
MNPTRILKKQVTGQTCRPDRFRSPVSRIYANAYVNGMQEDSDFVESIQYITDPLKLKTLSLSSNPDIQLASIRQIRKLLSDSFDILKNDKFIESGIIPVLVKYLKHKNSNVVFEATWALTNLASGTSEQTQAVVDSGAIPLLIDLLESDNSEIVNQAIWALSNIVGDENADFREQCIKLGIIPKLLKFIDASDSPTDLIRNVAGTMVNLCRPKIPPISIQNVQKILQGFEKLINHHDATVVSDSLWGIDYIIEPGEDDNEAKVQLILKNKIFVKRIIKLLNHPESEIQSPAIRIIGNIIYGTNLQTQEILDFGILTNIKELLHSSDDIYAIKDILWALSNILKGPIEHVNAVFDAGLFSTILEYSYDEEIRIENELILCIKNAAEHPKYVEIMINMGFIQSLSEILKNVHGSDVVHEENILINVLTALQKFTIVGNKKDVLKEIQNSGGAHFIAKLQKHENEEIQHLAKSYFGKFFLLYETLFLVK